MYNPLNINQLSHEVKGKVPTLDCQPPGETNLVTLEMEANSFQSNILLTSKVCFLTQVLVSCAWKALTEKLKKEKKIEKEKYFLYCPSVIWLAKMATTPRNAYKM